ncbi:uncharacterized protein LAESUDRAFT_230795 [Laetiporus sulphureus 93-53]|uniref:Uncharacterized protein n=1 Tax=Laetiporus sulphureus 93-53 TaxID=1314785 RepID=A0A165DQW4_9APHY|nr:uncharacterized protein LAESUDRAFT_230795 [Laetiporus sulphureus 93-53]KZT05433.1 hypothetical protein LAESUDRAFT_230795 [Laetiporus sulphureus 93-53]
MAGQPLASPIVLTRAPSSPFSAAARETSLVRGLGLFQLPSRSFLTATTSTSEERSLCESPKPIEDILDLQHDSSRLSAGTRVRSGSMELYSRLLDQAAAAHAKRNTLVTARMLTTRRSTVPSVFDSHFAVAPLKASQLPWRDWRRTRPHSPHDQLDSPGRDRCAEGVGAGDAAGDALGLIYETRSQTGAPFPPPLTLSSRLRKLAPPPLPLSPLSVPSSALMRPSTTTDDSASSDLTRFSFAASPARVFSASRYVSVSPTTMTSVDSSEGRPGTSLSSYEILQWRRTPLTASPAIPVVLRSTRGGSQDALHSAVTRVEEPPTYSEVLALDEYDGAGPPPMPRAPFVPLPPSPTEFMWPDEDDDSQSPLQAQTNLREALAVGGLIERAQESRDAVRAAAMSLCSCSLLKDPQAIRNLCASLESVLDAIQEELGKTPEEQGVGESQDLRAWFDKHWQIVSSLKRNLNTFYMFTDQMRRRPPRIHRLADYVDKLRAFWTKFSDIVRRLELSREKLQLLRLRVRYTAEHLAACFEMEAERTRRLEFRNAWLEGRALRRTMREEIRRSKQLAQQLRATDVD